MLNDEIIANWKRHLDGMSRWADDGQDVKVARKYFLCFRLLNILEEIAEILHKQLD